MAENTFAGRILAWFAENGRKDLPWQRNPTAYRVWVSEIMLQQTQVATVIPYYERFMQSFGDIRSLAAADTDAVLHYWSGLGYYARARNLHEAARIVRDRFAGEFPADFADVVALPGIGRSTAGAILALSRGERYAILDGNVKRVLARFYAIPGWPGTTSVANMLWEKAELHTPSESVASYTQAIMDLGATICTRTKPRCDNCPLAADCAAHAAGTETGFPGKRAKANRPRRRTHMLLVHCDNTVYLERRPASGIWGGLWSLPELDSAAGIADWCASKFNTGPERVENWEVLSHSFTHFELDIQPIAVLVRRPATMVADDADSTWYEAGSSRQLGIAAPVAQLLRNFAGAMT